METTDRILQLLRDHGVPERSIRRELADLCGISQQAVAQWFDKSTRRISPEFLARIAERYGSTVDYLITGRHAEAATPALDMEIDRLIDLIIERQPEFTAEHFAALELLLDGLRARAAARFKQPPQGLDKK